MACFLASLVALGLIYGMAAARYQLFPYPTLRAAMDQVRALKIRALELDEAVALPDQPRYRIDPAAPTPAEGLLLVVGMDDELVNFARVVTRSGEVVQEWRPNWFDIWPDGGFVPPDRRPQSPPGVLVHGAAIAPDGDLVFNFDHLSTVRLDPCGTVRWKLQNYGHHSVFFDDGGDIWVSAERGVAGGRGYPHLRDMTIQKLSPAGEVLLERSLIDILVENRLDGLLHMIRATPAEGDTLHLNDVKVFPHTLAPGFFGAGDILVSLRDVNTVLVLDPTGQRVKFIHTGAIMRQHDPEFTSGDTISVFDNHNPPAGALADEPLRSRVVEIKAPSGTVREVFGAGPAYFTRNMGMHQILPNGNVLVTVTWQGQLLEIAPDGRLAWQLVNQLGDGRRGLLTQGDLLPPEMDAAFFQRLKARCGAGQ